MVKGTNIRAVVMGQLILSLPTDIAADVIKFDVEIFGRRQR